MMRRPPSSSPPHTLFPSPTLFRSPVVWLDYDDRCPDRPTRALLLSELATFLAQIEAHMGKRSLIAPGPNFEADYQVTRGIARTTWLRRDFFTPDYGAHPWAMWQANDFVRLSGAVDRKSTRLNSSH